MAWTAIVTCYVALLRAVNVGGAGRLPMSDLERLCKRAGFRQVRTCGASGNALFDSDTGPQSVRRALQPLLQRYFGHPVGVVVRTAAELAAVLKNNPFPDCAPQRTMAIFLNQASPPDTLRHIRGQTVERISVGKREIYVHYGAGLGVSRLKIAAAASGTARNLNTVARLVAMACPESGGSGRAPPRPRGARRRISD